MKKPGKLTENLDPLESGRIIIPQSTEADEREALIENADRKNIDSILLSEDVQKGGKIRITLKRPFDSTYGFLISIPAEEWAGDTTIEMLKNRFGGGHYKCQTFRANGQMYKPFEFSIDPRFKGDVDVDALRATNGDKSATDATTKQLIDSLLKRPDDSGFKSNDMLKFMEMSNQRSDQTMAMMMTMMMKSAETNQQTMATMMAAMLQGKSGGGTDVNQVLLEMVRAKSDKPPMMEALEMMKAMKEFVSNEPPKEEQEPEDMFSKVLKFAGPLVAGLAQARAPQQQQQLPPGQPPPRPRPAGMMGMLPPEFRILLQMGLKAAEKNSDPGIYFDLLVDQLEPDQMAMMQQVVADDNWCRNLFGSDEAVAHIRPWLDDLRELILNYAKEDTSRTTDPAGGDIQQDTVKPGPTGPGSNPPGDGGSSGADGAGTVSP